MPIFNEISLSISFGVLCILIVWAFNKKLPELKELAHLFLTGGLFYGGFVSFYYGITGKYFASDDTRIRILVFLSGIVLIWLGYSILRRHIKRKLR